MVVRTRPPAVTGARVGAVRTTPGRTEAATGGAPMGLKLTNTLTARLEPIEPLEAGHVRIYSCGPTVYGPAHVGNFRSFVFADLLVRYLEWSGYRVTWVMNITDVDDKIIRGAAREGIVIGELAARWERAFVEDARTLRIRTPSAMPRATEHIPAMADLVAKLIERGHAYRTDDGSTFFRISSWPQYGRLARIDAAQQRVGERVEADEYGKDDVRDFALWKGAKEGEPSWQAGVGPGRPGWHVECSAMSMAYLGPSFDIHTGGIDLVFPHHEDEIAQSEAATGLPFVRMWVHCAHLQMGGQKMAKRDGNIELPADVYARGHSPRALRYALIAAQYRVPLEFGEESLQAASAATERLGTVLAALDSYREDADADETLPDLLDAARRRFTDALDEDLNTSPALAAVFELVRELNRRLAERRLSTTDAERAAAFLRDLDRVLAVMEDESGEETLSDSARGRLERRAAARAAHDWEGSDRLRDELAGMGIVVQDTRDGQRWKRAVEVTGG
jgi:cysteinyl-tRNA synthetase